MAPRLKTSGNPAAPRRGELEHIEQVHLILWTDGGDVADLFPNARKIFAIPNGGHRNVVVAGKLKAEGVRPGIPDLCFPEARGGYFGLWIEMKVRPNRPSPEQIQHIDQLNADGYLAVICWSAEEAQALLSWYLSLAPTPQRVAATPPILLSKTPADRTA